MSTPARPESGFEYYQSLLSGIHTREVALVDKLTSPKPGEDSRKGPLLVIPGYLFSFQFDRSQKKTHPIIAALTDSDGPHQGEVAVLQSGTTGDFAFAFVRNSQRALYMDRGSNVTAFNLTGLSFENRPHPSEIADLLRPRAAVLPGYSSFDLKCFISSVVNSSPTVRPPT